LQRPNLASAPEGKRNERSPKSIKKMQKFRKREILRKKGASESGFPIGTFWGRSARDLKKKSTLGGKRVCAFLSVNPSSRKDSRDLLAPEKATQYPLQGKERENRMTPRHEANAPLQKGEGKEGGVRKKFLIRTCP